MEANTTFLPLLLLRRLAISRGGNSVYDERFHEGVNIIHGENGSGKSTIMDFLFYVLGGEVGEWKEYASLCDTVVAELTLNDTVVTLRREISRERQRPMHIFFGSFERAMSQNVTGWESFPFRRSETRLSFTQVLFRALHLPEAQTFEGQNVTIHQVLRLLYADQMSPVQRIFRFEAFDPPIMKEAVGNLLCGVGGFELLERQTELKELEREFASASAELRSMMTLAPEFATPLNQAGLRATIEQLRTEQNSLYLELDSIARPDFSDSAESKQHEADRRKAFEDVSRIRARIQLLESEVRALEFEINDSELFIDHLANMLAAIETSKLAYEELGGIKFEYCPACFSPIPEGVQQDHCHLCKEQLPEGDKSSRMLAVKLDLQVQYRESKQLQEERRRSLEICKRELRSLRREHLAKSVAYDALSRTPITSRDARISAINQRIGYIDSSVQSLSEKIEMARRFDELSSRKARVNDRLSQLKDEIHAIQVSQERRKREAYTRIADHTLELLRNDTGVQEDFVTAQSLTFSFGDDAVFVDGKANFAASSLVILKNSFHFGMLFAALDDSNFLLPRFMMFDNIEDKGMVQERSWNFQELVCTRSRNSKVKHQIIFTTSKLSPRLRGGPEIIGTEYSKAIRTLRIM